MPFENMMPHALSNMSVMAHAPAAPGLYGLSNASEWIYIGVTNNIQAQLIEHLREQGTPVMLRRPAGFTYEICARDRQSARHHRLCAEYAPVCNRAAGSGDPSERKRQ